MRCRRRLAFELGAREPQRRHLANFFGIDGRSLSACARLVGFTLVAQFLQPRFGVDESFSCVSQTNLPDCGGPSDPRNKKVYPKRG